MRIVPFQPEHEAQIALQAMQQTGDCDDDRSGIALSGLDGDKVVFCCGISDTQPSILWGLLSECAAKHMVVVVRTGQRLIARHRGPLFALVRADFPQAHRLIRMLGFKYAAPALHAFPDGTSGVLYARGL